MKYLRKEGEGFLRIGNGVGKQGYGNRPPIDDRNPIRQFSIDPLDTSKTNGTTRPQLTHQGRESKRKPIRKFSIGPASSIRTSIADPVFADPVSETPRVHSITGSVELNLERVGLHVYRKRFQESALGRSTVASDYKGVPEVDLRTIEPPFGNHCCQTLGILQWTCS